MKEKSVARMALTDAIRLGWLPPPPRLKPNNTPIWPAPPHAPPFPLPSMSTLPYSLLPYFSPPPPLMARRRPFFTAGQRPPHPRARPAFLLPSPSPSVPTVVPPTTLSRRLCSMRFPATPHSPSVFKCRVFFCEPTLFFSPRRNLTLSPHYSIPPPNPSSRYTRRASTPTPQPPPPPLLAPWFLLRVRSHRDPPPLGSPLSSGTVARLSSHRGRGRPSPPGCRSPRVTLCPSCSGGRGYVAPGRCPTSTLTSTAGLLPGAVCFVPASCVRVGPS